VKAWYPVQPGNAGVRQHQGQDEHQAATQRVVRAGDGRLEGVGDEQDEDEVVQGELPDLAFSKDAQRNQQRDVDQYRAENELPGGYRRQK